MKCPVCGNDKLDFRSKNDHDGFFSCYDCGALVAKFIITDIYKPMR
jgi:transcription elongation factor Elf1